MADRETHAFGMIGITASAQSGRSRSISTMGMSRPRKKASNSPAIGVYGPIITPSACRRDNRLSNSRSRSFAALRVGDQQRKADLIEYVVRGFDEAGC
jgi:hypothetical protein